MRLITALTCALALAAAPAFAEAPKSKFVVSGKTLESTPLAAWEDSSGALQTAVGKPAVAKAPKNATKYSVKAVGWPTGTVRVFTYGKAARKAGAVLHVITDETQVFVLKGSAKFDIAGTSTVAVEGDAVILPKGAVRAVNGGEVTLVTWNVSSLGEAQKQMIVRGKDVEENSMPAAGLVLKRYTFPGNSIRFAKQSKGVKTTANSAKTDSLIYYTSGHVVLHEGDEVQDVYAGDFVWEEAGQTHFWDQVDNGSFVTTSALPKGAASIAPADATDIPGKKK